MSFYMKSFLSLLVLLGGIPCQGQIDTVVYRISARNMSPRALDSYPQRLLSLQKNGEVYTAEVTTFATYQDKEKGKIVLRDVYDPARPYPDSVAAYLEPTGLVDFRLPQVGTIADTLFRDSDTLTLQVIDRALKFSSKYLTFDSDLAKQLDAGTCLTLDVGAVLQRRAGTCSEYVNLFLALMRRAGIPCRMVVGYVYIPEQNFKGSHAWAECYVQDYGWFAVDPQNGFYWYPAFAIKMFYGKDFVDCNIRSLPELYPVEVEILEKKG